MVTVTRPLRLAYLADERLVQLGIDQRHTGGDDFDRYDLSSTWALAIHGARCHTPRVLVARPVWDRSILALAL